eukprot:TRINITY_DN7963_c0_g1_i1.p1 TRINITY_DN7963_c0_g1~~TRINITY_DN7963_c0_g1_i1.p1  ORF type:complete len:145 (+),score=22.63 TRINITY_DN7963_c0_g1_i1:45-437(+)
MGFYQTETTAGSGNALQACIATMLNVESMDSVPNFIAAPEGYLVAIQSFLKSRNLMFLKVPLTAEGELPFPSGAGQCVIAGKSPRGDHKHCVVGSTTTSSTKLTLVHDPYEGGNGLESHEWAGFLVHTTN